jgi:hypothetical protein
MMPTQNNGNAEPRQRPEYSWESLQVQRNLSRDVNAQDNRGLSLDREDETLVCPPEIEITGLGTCRNYCRNDGGRRLC